METKPATDAGFRTGKRATPYFAGSINTVRELLTHLDSDPTHKRIQM